MDGALLAQKLFASVGADKGNSSGIPSRDGISKSHLTPDSYQAENASLHYQVSSCGVVWPIWYHDKRY